MKSSDNLPSPDVLSWRWFPLFTRTASGALEPLSGRWSEALSKANVALFECPSRFLAKSMEENRTDQFSLDPWIQKATELLVTCRARRDSLIILEREACFTAPEPSELAKEVTSHPADVLHRVSIHDQMFEVFASLFIEKNQGAAAAINELRALSQISRSSPAYISADFTARLVLKNQIKLAELEQLPIKLDEESAINDGLRTELFDIRRTLRDAQDENRTLRENNTKHRREIDFLKKQHAKSVENFDQLNQDMRVLLASTSWKLTAPVRALKRALTQ